MRIHYERRRIAFAAVVVLCLGILSFNVNPAAASSAGAITAVCVSGNTVYVHLHALGDSADNANGDQIGMYVNVHSIVWTYIPADGQYHDVTLSQTVTPAEAAATLFVAAGDGNGSNGTVGSGYSGMGNYPPTVCAGFAGPGVPAGFVLKTITCNVAVYDAPGGKPVGSNAITSGQTWYVNPTPKKDAAGKSWTEVFVAGYTNGFVPTSCVH